MMSDQRKLLKLDLGCGPNPQKGFVGVDSIAFNDQIVVHNLGYAPWPFEDDSVEQAYSSHFLEHLTNFEGKWERVTFFNELWRVMIHGGKCTLILPHWASTRYYGDPTHKEPFSERGFYYLDRAWRLANAPHTDAKHNPNGYRCCWQCQWGYVLEQSLLSKKAEEQQFAARFYKEACQDIVCSMTAIKQ